MSTLVLVRYYPARSETFVRRQAERLSASVMCERFFPESYSSMGLTGDVHEIGKAGPIFENYLKVRASLGLLSEIWSPEQKKRAAAAVQAVQPRAVLAHFGPNALRIAPLCKRKSIPLFIHFHGYDASSLLRTRSYREAISDVLDFCSGAVVVSDAMGETINRLGINEDKLAVIPCGVDVTIFENGFPGARNVDSCTFLMVGRLVEKKAPMISLKAFEACADAVPDCQLRIVGFGPMTATVDEHIRNSRHKSRIQFLGPMDFSDVRKELASADVFIQHSITASDGNTEGWPISIAEAAAAGLPIVSTRHAGIPMQVIDGQTGFLVEEGDVDSMGRRMAELAKDNDMRETMGSASRTHIRRVGSIDDSVERLKDFIESRL